MAQSIYRPAQVEAPTQSSTGRCDHDTAVPWRKQSSRRFFLDEPAPPHSISAPSLDHLIGHREDSRRNGEAVPWRSRHSPNRKPPFREALPTSVAVEAPLAEWVPSADRQDLCRKMRTKPRNRGLSRGEPKVRIHLPPADSRSLAGFLLPVSQGRRLPRRGRARPGGTAGRDAQGSSTSRQLPATSLSGPIPVPQCRLGGSRLWLHWCAQARSG
jgi:hypothetical protein